MGGKKFVGHCHSIMEYETIQFFKFSGGGCVYETLRILVYGATMPYIQSSMTRCMVSPAHPIYISQRSLLIGSYNRFLPCIYVSQL